MKADYTTPPCCARQSISVMDHAWPVFGEPSEIRVNRMCMNCGMHWAGSVGEVQQCTRAEWDALVEQTFAVREI